MTFEIVRAFVTKRNSGKNREKKRERLNISKLLKLEIDRQKNFPAVNVTEEGLFFG